MKERQPYRNIFVCYDDWRCLGWRTEEEFNQLLAEGRVTWFNKGGDKKPIYPEKPSEKPGEPEIDS